MSEMKLLELSAKKLKRLSDKKKIICFGAGEGLSQIFTAFSDLHIEKNIICILDNDKKKWGNYRLVNGRKIEIKNPDLLKNSNITKYIILITMFRYEEVFEQIQSYTKNADIMCVKIIQHRTQTALWFERLAKRLPLKQSIVLQGEGDSCENAVAFARALLDSDAGKKYKLYWLCNHPEIFTSNKREIYIFRNANLSKVPLLEQIKYINAVNRSRYLIFDNQEIAKRRDNQISIYLNHGSPPLKATKGKIVLPKDLNYAVCPSEGCADIISQQYSVNKKRLIYCGSPRTDVLFDAAIRQEISAFVDRNKYERVILWVPTFRQHYRNGRVDSEKIYKSGMPVIEEAEDWNRLVKALEKNNTLLIIKPHLLQDLTKLKIPENNSIIFITQRELNEKRVNVYDLMKACDAMITDYSTIAFDFMLLDRSIGYTVDDMEDYTIGFSVENPFEYMPGTKINCVDDYIGFIQDIHVRTDSFRDERHRVNKMIHGDFMDGNNAKRLIELLRL